MVTKALESLPRSIAKQIVPLIFINQLREKIGGNVRQSEKQPQW